MGSLAKVFLPKVCGNSAENSRKFARNTFYCVRKGCGNSAESLRKFRGHLQKIFCNEPFPNDLISELLNNEEGRWGGHREAAKERTLTERMLSGAQMSGTRTTSPCLMPHQVLASALGLAEVDMAEENCSGLCTMDGHYSRHWSDSVRCIPLSGKS